MPNAPPVKVKEWVTLTELGAIIGKPRRQTERDAKAINRARLQRGLAPLMLRKAGDGSPWLVHLHSFEVERDGLAPVDPVDFAARLHALETTVAGLTENQIALAESYLELRDRVTRLESTGAKRTK